MFMLNAKALGMKSCVTIIGIFPWENMIIYKANYCTLLLVFFRLQKFNSLGHPCFTSRFPRIGELILFFSFFFPRNHCLELEMELLFFIFKVMGVFGELSRGKTYCV